MRRPAEGARLEFHPLGPVDGWPRSLKTATSICLESRYGICVFWGPDLVAIYNDAYVPMLGTKHPAAMGTPLRDIWPEIWDQIGPMLARRRRVGAGHLAGGPAAAARAQWLPRGGVLRLSFSPIRGDAGEVAGVFTAVHETSKRVLGTRRLEALAALGEALAGARPRPRSRARRSARSRGPRRTSRSRPCT